VGARACRYRNSWQQKGRHIPDANKAEGKIVLPGGVSIFLTRIGPGIFFGLFGIAVIGYSVTRPIEFILPTSDGAEIKLSGFAERDAHTGSVARAPTGGLEPEIVVGDLNGLLVSMQDAQPQLSPKLIAEIEAAIRTAKFAIMLGRWKPEWGERAPFELWARERSYKDPPPELVPGAAAIFYAPRR
jgi:hypothetical protein